MDGQAYHDEEADEPRTEGGAHPWLHEAVALRTGSSLEPLVYEPLCKFGSVKIDAAQGV